MSLSELGPVGRPRLFERVIERLCSHIVAVGMGEGDRLPSERDLTRRLGVSRSSVRQALTALEAQGIISTRHGDGSFLRRVDLNQPPFVTITERRRRLPFVMEARAALETKTAELAAHRKTDTDVALLYAALDQMEKEITAGEIGSEGDARFHRAVAAAAHNPILYRLWEDLSEDIAETRFESLSQPGRPTQSLADHRKIADAIADGNAEAARRAMQQHIDLVADSALLHWKP